MAEEQVPEEGMARNYEQELTELKEEFEKLQEHLSNVEVRYQTEIQETNKQKENDFAVQLMNVVTNLFGRSQYSDLKILLENGNELCVHKLVLLSRSNDWDVPDLDEVDVLDLKGIKYDVAYSMLKWVYTDQIEFEENKENLVEMLKLSTKFKLEPLQIRCQNFMIEIVNVDNCNTFYQAASETSAELLKDYCQEFLSKHQEILDIHDDLEQTNLTFPEIYRLQNQVGELDEDKIESLITVQEYNESVQLKKPKTTSKLPFACVICGLQFPNEAEFTSHGDVHTQSESFICKLCGHRFKTDAEVKLHLIQHSKKPVVKFVCNICHKPFTEKRSFIKHMRIHEGVGIKCEICNRIFMSKADLDRHHTVHTQEKPFKCSFCEKRFRLKPQMKTHLVLHTGEKRFECDVCGKRFATSPHFRQHMMLNHTLDLPFHCEHCPRGFAIKSQLTYHMRKHTGEKPYVCDICGKSFTVRNSLDRHLLTHSDSRPHPCHECGKAFRRKSQLKRHSLTHTDIRNYQCSVCGDRFRDKFTMTSHMYTHTNQKPYACDVCSEAFRSASCLRKHKRKHDS